MSTNPKAPYFVLTAAMRLYPRLPQLVGADWPNVQPQIDAYIAALQANPEAYLESTQLLGLLARYEAARQAFTAEMKVQETVTHNLTAPTLKRIWTDSRPMCRKSSITSSSATRFRACRRRMRWVH